MKIAILTVTDNGKILGESIMGQLTHDSTVIKAEIFHKNVKKNIENCFNEFNCIIGIMATGIMIRNICSIINKKENDPAILIIDEKGKHVISLLSGHLGGANKLAVKIAQLIGSDPVITTSTDLNHKFGIDCVASKYYFKIEPVSNIKTINSSLINNQVVKIDYNHDYEYLWEDKLIQNTYQKGSNKSKKLIVSNDSTFMELVPKKLVLGLGSRKNINYQQIITAIKRGMEYLNLPVDRIDTLTTGEMKKNEHGILKAAKTLQIPLKIISENKIKEYTNPDMTYSDFVMTKFGVGGVCEPSSLIEAGKNSELILRKTSFNGVTVAVSLSKN